MTTFSYLSNWNHEIHLCRSSHRRCSTKKVFLLISQNLQETPVPKSLFYLYCMPEVFSFDFCEIFLRNTFGRLLLFFIVFGCFRWRKATCYRIEYWYETRFFFMKGFFGECKTSVGFFTAFFDSCSVICMGLCWLLSVDFNSSRFKVWILDFFTKVY